MRPDLLAWQFEHYSLNHADRANLALHAVTVPLFVLGLPLFVLALAGGRFGLAGVGLVLTLLALAAQGRGHRREQHAPVPFRSRGDMIARLVAEQFVTFPRFVLSGGFARAWRTASQQDAQ
ncbi:terminase [Nannocystis sp. ILAH1]|uniref:terminase n=1 Tax=unclassified Nannocystis TaxID=2627009 RepID=UPI002270E956|nr:MULTISPECIES: terminase [unclassified Nannocystis]MCY0993871.1 terminase [Nannocystis sp. ILAH1]MCY1065765.1 terminase [Nannocystis sp. RBIL2]